MKAGKGFTERFTKTAEKRKIYFPMLKKTILSI